VPSSGVSLVLEPSDKKKLPRSDYEGKFSLQYSTAAMLARGSVGVSDYTDEAISDQAVLDISKKVEYEVKEYATYPQAFPGGVRIKTTAGEELAAELEYQKGGPDNPMSREEVVAKYRGNAELALGDEAVATLQTSLLGIETQPSVGAAIEPIAHALTAEPATV